MMHIFECHLVAGSDPSTLLSEEALRETQAQVMTPDEARAVGFGKFSEAKDGGEVRLVAVAMRLALHLGAQPPKVQRFVAVSARDAQWIHRVMERSPIVTSYKVHEVG